MTDETERGAGPDPVTSARPITLTHIKEGALLDVGLQSLMLSHEELAAFKRLLAPREIALDAAQGQRQTVDDNAQARADLARRLRAISAQCQALIEQATETRGMQERLTGARAPFFEAVQARLSRASETPAGAACSFEACHSFAPPAAQSCAQGHRGRDASQPMQNTSPVAHEPAPDALGACRHAADQVQLIVSMPAHRAQLVVRIGQE